MYRLLSTAFILLIALTDNVIAYDHSVAESFQDCEIVPIVIPKAPTYLANVKYGNTKIELGNKMAITDLGSSPTVSWNADCNENYTLIMIGSIAGDPDAPSGANPILGPVLHWLVINIPGTDIAKGEPIAPYIRPAPPPGTSHRYLFLIYKQSSPLQMDVLSEVGTSLIGRLQFPIVDFAKKNNLGNPVAGNFLRTQFLEELPGVLNLFA